MNIRHDENVQTMHKDSQLTGHDADHLRLVLAAGGIGLWELDLVTQEAWRNLGHDQIFGYDEMLPEWTYELFMEHVVPEDRAYVDQLYRKALLEQPDWSFECRIKRADGAQRWISANGKRLGSAAEGNERLIGHVLDVTRIKQAEDRLRLMSAEQNHRVRNMLTVLQAMVKMTLRKSANLSEFQGLFMGRMTALIRSHSIFSGEKAVESQGVADLIAAELDVFVASDRVEVTGAEGLAVDRATSENLTLILHELLTNALKYGSLSNDTGRVEMRFERIAANSARLCWRETGGPPVTAPSRTGFGTSLLRSSLAAQGTAPIIEFDPAGLTCELVFPVKAASGG